MNSRVNLKARIKRHSRILKEDFKKVHPLRGIYHKFNYNVVFFIIVFIIPIYPVFASIFHDNTIYDFYRGDINEETILDSYVSGDSEEQEITLKGSFLSVDTIGDETRDLSGVNEIIEYTIKPGDSFGSIAYNFGVSNNSIYWANNFSSKKVLQPGELIKIPPVSGLIHKVNKGDTLDSLAKKYKISKEDISKQNSLSGKVLLEEGLVLVIPGAVKEVERISTYRKQYVKKPSSGYSFTAGGKSSYIKDDGEYPYKLVRRKPQHTFYWGNCTRFVGMYKNVNWGGNAKDWIKNAKAKGHSIGDKPGVGAIIVFHGRGYNPKYGHVGIVVDVNGSEIIVKDMNYRRLNEVTVRKIPASDRSIKGYIYVN